MPIAVLVVALLLLMDASWIEIAGSLGALAIAALVAFLSRRPPE
jgi:hypothetical protein